MLPSPSTTDISTDQPTDSESGAVSGNTSDQSTVSAALRIRTLSSLQEQPLNLSLNLPRKSPPPPAAASSQVLDNITANLSSNPSTPATRTYSRKRKNKSLVLSFNELMAASETAESTKKTRKMPTIVPLNTRNNSLGGSDLTTSSIPSQTSNMVTYTTDPNQPYLHPANTHLQPDLILPNIPATIEPVPSSAAGYPSGSNVVRRTVHEPPQVSVIPINASQPRRFFLPSRLPRDPVEVSALPSSVTVTPVPARNLQAVPYSSSSNGVFRYVLTFFILN